MTMRSYIKVCGPPVMEAIRALEMIAIEMPEVSIMDTIIVQGLPSHLARDVGVSPRRATGSTPRGQFAGNWAINYFRSSRVAVPVERSVSIISDAGESLGDHDFFFEWREDPSSEQLFGLIEKIDEALAPLGCYYTITTS
ncbi:MAG: hypothetical protein NWF12_06555 [Candidatus Bathyarchaeota archaeon]|nr:hypothetical protein [Candidatus Bathyarchaeota archaeon]